MYISHVRYRIPQKNGKYKIVIEQYDDNDYAVNRYLDLCEYTKYSAITVKRLKK